MSRILLCLGNTEASRELAETLTPQHECLKLPPQSSLGDLSFDLAVIDAAGYRQVSELLRRRGGREGSRPPLLLLVSDASSPGEANVLTYEVDEVIFSPIRPAELSMRVARLLHARDGVFAPAKAQATEAALRKAEARLAEMQALAHAGYFEVDLDSSAIWWSRELFQLFGREPSEGPVPLADFLGLVHPEDRSFLSQSYRGALEKGNAPPGEFRAAIAGEIRTFVGSARLHVDGARGLRSLQGAVIDITDAKWRALKEAVSAEMTELVVHDQPVSEFVARGLANFARLFPELVMATVLWDEAPPTPSVLTRPELSPDLRQLFQDAKLCKGLLQAAGHSLAPVVIEDLEADPRCTDIRDRARAHGLMSCWHVPLVSTEQRMFGCQLVFSPRRGQPRAEELGMSVRAARLTSIVVERSRSITKVRESEARLRALLDHAPLGVCLADSEGRAIHANRTLYALAGAQRDFSNVEWAAYIHPDDRERALESWARLARGEIPSVDITYRLLTASGDVRTVHALVNAVRHAAAQPEYVVTVEDVTQRLRLEEQLRQSQKMEAVGRLAGGIAHDFNNMLTVILNGLTLLEQSAAPSEQERVKQLLDAGERAAALTNQLLAFSRRVPIQRKTGDLRGIVASVSRLLKNLLGEHTALELDLGPREALACVSANMIEQVLMNLVINARDAMPRGGKIRLRLQPSIDAKPRLPEGATPAGTFHQISVSDAGTGIAQEDLPRIFEPFYTTKAEGKGTGLGLAIVYSIVQQHGGWVDVESEPGQGTTFHVYLPSAGEPSGAGT